MDSIFSTQKAIKKMVHKCACSIQARTLNPPIPVVMLGVLNGAMPFLTDLTRNLPYMDMQIDTIQCKSYSGMFVREKVKITKKPDLDLNGLRVIIVEDIVDSGETITAIKKYLNKSYKEISSIEVCSLFKRDGCDLYLEHLGRVVPDGLWLYGYGMDNDQLDRNIPEVMIKS